MPPIRIGTLGTSRIATRALLEPAAEVPGVTVTAVAARDSTYAGQLRAFAAAIKAGGGSVPTSAAHAVITMRVIDDAYRAADLLVRP